jgi:hypothetical protein
MTAAKWKWNGRGWKRENGGYTLLGSPLRVVKRGSCWAVLHQDKTTITVATARTMGLARTEAERIASLTVSASDANSTARNDVDERGRETIHRLGVVDPRIETALRALGYGPSVFNASGEVAPNQTECWSKGADGDARRRVLIHWSLSISSPSTFDLVVSGYRAKASSREGHSATVRCLCTDLETLLRSIPMVPEFERRISAALHVMERRY